MNPRVVVSSVALSLLLIGCPNGGGKPDAGPDSSVPVEKDGGPVGGCTSADGGNPCGPHQVCNTTTHQCEEGCNPKCSFGQICVGFGGTFRCERPAQRCGATSCDEGQPVCLGSSCTCLPWQSAPIDSCYGDGRRCSGLYNPVLGCNGTCRKPKLYEQCKGEDGGYDQCPGGTCITCGEGQTCSKELFGSQIRVCMNKCEIRYVDGGVLADGGFNRDAGFEIVGCNSDEICDVTFPDVFDDPEYNVQYICHPKYVFGCRQADPAAGSFSKFVPVSNTCVQIDILWDPQGRSFGGFITDPQQPQPTTGTGNCRYAAFELQNKAIPVTVCAPPGGAGPFERCKRDYRADAGATTCVTGYECMTTGCGDEGICMKMCNAAENQVLQDGGVVIAKPLCAAGEGCINIHRFDDINAVLGVCAKRCNVFQADAGCGFNIYGSTPSECVPTTRYGREAISSNGAGFCFPRVAGDAGLFVGDVCGSTDPFKGAACPTGSICTTANPISQVPACVQLCDIGCNPRDGGPAPVRCSTEPSINVFCPADKQCVQAAGNSTVGLCQ